MVSRARVTRCLQELLLKANIEEMRCAVPRSRGEPRMQVTPGAPHPGSVFVVARTHCSRCPAGSDTMSPSFSLSRLGSQRGRLPELGRAQPEHAGADAPPRPLQARVFRALWGFPGSQISVLST